MKRFIVFSVAALIIGGCVTRPIVPRSLETIPLDQQHADRLAEDFQRQITADYGAGITRFKMAWPEKKTTALFGQSLEQKLRRHGYAVSSADDKDPAGLLLRYSVDQLADRIVVRVSVAGTILARIYRQDSKNNIVAVTGFSRLTHAKGERHAN